MLLNETLAFVTVVETGSFTAAGRKLGVPKSTLSRQVTRLEEHLGARLLQRTTRRLSLTELGDAYFQRCQKGIEEIEEAGRVALDVSGAPRGRLKVSAPVDLAREGIADLVPEFRRRYPEIDLVFVLSQRRLDMLEEKIDVALRGGVMPDSGFVARKLFESEVLLCASVEYLDRRGRPTTEAELSEHDFIAMGDGSGGLGRLPGPNGGLTLPRNPWLSANEWGFLKASIVAGMGVGPLIIQHARPLMDAGILERVMPEYGLMGGGLYAVYPSRHHLTPKVRVFVDFLLEALPAQLENAYKPSAARAGLSHAT